MQKGCKHKTSFCPKRYLHITTVRSYNPHLNLDITRFTEFLRMPKKLILGHCHSVIVVTILRLRTISIIIIKIMIRSIFISIISMISIISTLIIPLLCTHPSGCTTVAVPLLVPRLLHPHSGVEIEPRHGDTGIKPPSQAPIERDGEAVPWWNGGGWRVSQLSPLNVGDLSVGTLTLAW